MYRVGIDVRMARHTGIGRYVRGFVSALSHTSPWRYILIGSSSFRNEFSGNFSYLRANVPIYSSSEQIVLPLVANACDCLHIPHYNAPALWPKKLVVTIHDLIHFEFSKDLNPLAVAYAKFLLPLIVRRADAVISVSEHTKKDLIEKLKVKPEKITVIHHGVDPIFLNEGLKDKGPQDPYFLYVGLIKSHKNLGVLLNAFIQLRNKKKLLNLRLKLVGHPDHKQKIVRQWMQIIAREPSIELTNHVSDEELRHLYMNATALIFPSLYEGFGFPLLEAMASRVPVIASNSTSIPEVLGNAGLYFDPRSQVQLESRMEEILRDEKLRQAFIAKGVDRVRQFDWKVTAEKIEKVYESVLNR